MNDYTRRCYRGIIAGRGFKSRRLHLNRPEKSFQVGFFIGSLKTRFFEIAKKWMQWLTTSHVRRHHRHYDSSGHVWQGRFKAFPIQSNDHLLTVLRYVERNPVRAKTIPVRKAQNWKWSSAGSPTSEFEPVKLHSGPAKRRSDWLDWVNKSLTEAERSAMHQRINRGSPFGSEIWQNRTAKRLDLQSTKRPRGRPRSSQSTMSP